MSDVGQRDYRYFISVKSDADILAYINGFISDDESEMVGALDNEDKALLQYLAGRRRPESELPFVGASNLDIGGMVTMSHVDSIHARMMFAAEKSQPLVTFTGDSQDDVQQANLYMQHVLSQDIDILGLLDDWGLESLIGGCRRAKACWEEERQRVAETWRVQIPPDVGAEDMTDEHVAILLINRLGKVFKDFKVVGEADGQWKVTYQRDGKTEKATVEWEVMGDVIRATVTYVKQTFRGVRTYVINPEDFHKSVGPMQTCKIITHRVWLTWEQIVQRVKDGRYKGIDISDDSADKVYAKRREDAYYTATSRAEQIRNAAAGVSPQSTLDKEFDLLECYILTDWHGDGILEDRIVTVFSDMRRIVRNKLRTADGMNLRPFSDITIAKIPGKPNHGYGIPKMIRDATDEESAVHNLTMDSAFLQAISPLFYSGSSTLKPEQRKLSVGRINSLPDSGSGRLSDAFYKPDFRADLQPLHILYQRLQTITQATDGVGETQLMQRPSPRTASQSAMVQNELNIRFQRIFGRTMGSKAKASMTGLSGLLEIIVDLYKTHGSPIEVVAKSGKQSSVAFPRSSNLSLQVNIDVNKLNQEQIMRNAQMVASAVSNPLMMQLQVVTPGNIFKAYRDLFVAMGVRSPEDYIVEPDPKLSAPVDAKRENLMMMRGGVVMPHPADNDMEHYREHKQMDAEVRAYDGGEQIVDEGYFAANEQHMTAHLRQAQAKQQASAMQSMLASQGEMMAGARPNGVPMAGGGPMPGQGEGQPAEAGGVMANG